MRRPFGILLALALSLVNIARAGDFMIRQAFDGARAEKKAASFSYLNPDEGDSYASVDLAIGHKGVEWEPFDGVWLLYPALEWRYRDEGNDEVNKLAINISTELYPLPAHESWPVPYLLASYKLAENFEEDEAEHTLRLDASAYSLSNYLPGSPNANWGRWFPYIGIEYLENFTVAEDGFEDETFNELFLRLRLSVTIDVLGQSAFMPVGHSFELGLDAEYRENLSENDDRMRSSYNHVSYEARYYFDEDQSLGVMLAHNDGRRPSDDFKELRETRLSLLVRY